jgi:ABC-type sugar transport system permease subunit
MVASGTGEPQGRSAAGAGRQWLEALRASRQETWGDTSGYLFIAPAVLLFLFFGAWPVLRGLSLAFTDYRYLIVDHQPFVGFQNFVEMVQDTDFRDALGRSLWFTLWYVPPIILLPLLLATLIARVRHGTMAATYRVAAYLPVVLPTSVAILLWAELFNTQFGYVNLFLRQVLRLPLQPAWLSDPALIIPTMAAASVWKHMGTNTLLFLVGLYNIPGELYEAAAIDGASGWRQWRYVTLPLLRPILVLVLVLSVEILSATQEALILFNGGGPQDAAMTAGVYAYLTAFRLGDMRWGYAAAINLTLGLMHMALAFVILRWLGSERYHA